MSTRKTYSREFKEEAIRLAKQNGNQSQTARDLGLQLSVLRRWKKELEQSGEKAFPGQGHGQEEELGQLQRENQRLKETVEILKKAMGWAPPVSSSTAPSKIPQRRTVSLSGSSRQHIHWSGYVRHWTYQ